MQFACIGLNASTSGLHIRWIDLKKVCGMLAPFWIWGVVSTFWWGLVVCASPVSFRVCIFHNQKMHVYLIYSSIYMLIILINYPFWVNLLMKQNASILYESTHFYIERKQLKLKNFYRIKTCNLRLSCAVGIKVFLR